jgi:calcineurin-like phosphoesterase family protein
MENSWIVSDQHFSHRNLINFKREDGTPLRPFLTVEEMDEHQIERHNSVVGKTDRVYFGGDVCFHNRDLDRIMPQLNGRKVLIKGNHDQLKVSQYMKYFDDIRAHDRIDAFILSHIPLHPDCFHGHTKGQWHGHTHYRNVTMPDPKFADRKIEDPRYFNVSVENINYTPISVDELIQLMRGRGL